MWNSKWCTSAYNWWRPIPRNVTHEYKEKKLYLIVPNEKKNKKTEKDKIENDIAETKSQLDHHHDNNLALILDNLNKKLDDIRKEEMEGLIVRSRARWIENGEKPTKYFLQFGEKKLHR